MFLLFHQKETSKYHSYTQNRNKKAVKETRTDKLWAINYVKQQMRKHILYALGGKPGKI